MKKIIVTGCFMLCLLLAGAQNVSENPRKTEEQKKLDALQGTYKLVYSGRTMSLLPSNLAELIEKHRKRNKINTIRLNDDVDVVIYPKRHSIKHRYYTTITPAF